MRAIILDESRAMRTVIRDVLRRARCQVLEAVTPVEALDAALEFRPVDLAIVDWGLPGKGALAFTREIRRRSEGANLWILMMTAALTADVALEALRAGADDWIVKPFERPALLEKVARLEAYRGMKP
jgi:two-component system chemotaxis response regulator CheY